MFSATMSDEIAKLAKGLLNDPMRIEASTPGTTVVKVEQKVILANTKQKRDELNTLLKDPALERVIIFSRTKHGADKVTKNLMIDGHEAAAIHGNKSQNARQAALKAFSSGKARILVATDIAARGIDVPNITHVINYELPDDPENYVHRIGRTARNGASGVAITLMNGEERSKLRDVERLIRRTLPVTGEFKTVAGDSASDATTHRPRGARPAGAAGKPRRPGGHGPRPEGQRPEGQRTQRPRPDGWLPEGKKVEGAEGKPAGARRPHGHGAPGAPTGGKPKQRWSGGQKRAAKAKRTGNGGAVRFGA
jgi:ATP-dependent RNA helicase RhlE